MTKYWSFSNLEQDKDGLGLEEFLEENLKIIGQILEAVAKPYFKLLLHINRIKRGNVASFAQIDKLRLGSLIDELIRTSGIQELFKPRPWEIRLNQWRNIAYHHNAKIDNGRIICWYIQKSDKKQISLTRDELLAVTRDVMSIYNTIKNTEFIFVFDNLEAIQDKCRQKGNDFSIRDEARILDFYSDIASQGFHIVDLIKDSDKSTLILEDLTDQKPKDRCIHASQFLYILWALTDSKNLSIEYRIKGGQPFFRSETTSEICKTIYDGDKELSYLARKAKFIFIEENMVIQPEID